MSVTVRVNSCRMKRAPWSSSSFSARTSTGTTRAVRTEPSTISVMMLGRVLAVLKAEATAGPSAAPMSTVRMKPVTREMRVATAMEPVARTTEVLLVPSSPSPVSAALVPLSLSVLVGASSVAVAAAAPAPAGASRSSSSMSTTWIVSVEAASLLSLLSLALPPGAADCAASDSLLSPLGLVVSIDLSGWFGSSSGP